MTKKNTTPATPATATAEAVEDRLSALIVDKEEMTETGAIVATIQSPPIRDAVANCINARCSVGSMNDLIVACAEHVPLEKLPSIVKIFSLSNGSQFRQSLESGWKMPPSGKVKKGSGRTAGI